MIKKVTVSLPLAQLIFIWNRRLLRICRVNSMGMGWIDGWMDVSEVRLRLIASKSNVHTKCLFVLLQGFLASWHGCFFGWKAV